VNLGNHCLGVFTANDPELEAVDLSLKPEFRVCAHVERLRKQTALEISLDLAFADAELGRYLSRLDELNVVRHLNLLVE
jgi:hypothetical protein